MLSQQQFNDIQVGDKVKNSKTGKFEKVTEIHDNVIVLESGYVMERSDLTTDDLQAVTPITKAYSYSRKPPQLQP